MSQITAVRISIWRNVRPTLAKMLAIACFSAFAGSLGGAAAPSALADEPLELGTQRELFADGYLIDKLDGARLRMHAPRDEGPVLPLDKPWEGPFSAYVTILPKEASPNKDRFMAYYRGLPQARRDGSTAEVTCYAESEDGVRWTKPELGLFEVAGSRQNNVILAEQAPFSHNFCPMLDGRPDVSGEERYKALAGSARSGLCAFVSADGVRWRKLRDEPVITGGAFDSQNVPFWSPAEQRYVCYYRVFVDRIRRIARVTSRDFLTWSEPVLMGYGDRPNEHLYTNQTHPYFRAPQIYVAIAARFFPGRRVLTEEQAAAINVHAGYFNDCSDAIFMTTRGGVQADRYDRTFMEGFLRPGVGLSNWTSRTNYPALNVVQTGPAEMSLYVNQDYGQPTAHLHRYSLRLDGFASLHGDYDGGEMTTRPLTFDGQRLSLNFATSAAGGVKVEIQTADGQPIPGFTLADSLETIGNEIDRTVSWKQGSDVSRLAGQPVRLRMVLKDADIYSLKFE